MSTAVLSPNVALVSESSRVGLSELSKLAQAYGVQVHDHLAPEWRVGAVVTPYANESDAPIDAWKIKFADQIDEPGAAGVHLDDGHQPYALVQVGSSFDETSLTGSHELCEMLVDPWGNRLCRAPSPAGDGSIVRILVEACDSPEAAQFGYRIGDVLVSDFLGHGFFRFHGRKGVIYSYTGAVTKPQQVLEGGYVSWESGGHWWQLTNFGAQEIRDLGVFDKSTASIREWIDQQTKVPKEVFQP